MPFCPSLRPSVRIYQLGSPPGQIYMKFRIEDFIKIGREIPNLVKIGQRYRALYMETEARFNPLPANVENMVSS